MERAFSVEEISDSFWAPPPPPLQPHVVAGGVGVAAGLDVGGGAVNRCASDWDFQKFLEEALLDGPAPPAATSPNPTAPETSGARGNDDEVVEVIPTPAPAPAAPAASAVLDPVAYNAMLKRKLEVDLAAVAMWRASRAMHSGSSLGNRASPNSDSSNKGSQNYIGGNGILLQHKLGGGTHLVQNADFGFKQTSYSSREPSPSDDDEMEGEAETMGNMNLTAEKVKKRKESNRESARRSRSRKAAHLKDLEEQVSLLRVENSSLLRRLADVNQKYNDAAVDNRVLKADVETLRTKVKMAEETVKRVTGTCQLPHQAMASLSIPFSGASPDGTTPDASVPIQDNPINYFAAGAAGANNGFTHEAAPAFQIEGAFHGGAVVGAGEMDATANLENLERRAFGEPSSVQWGAGLSDPSELVNMEMQ